jgi:glycosyltransferase involved in cell wall biosynthesis
MAIRVCELITELRPAGAERCVLELARRLPGQEFQVEVAALRGGSVAELLRVAGVPVHVLNMRGKWHVWRARRLAAVLRAGRFDILHTHLFHADVLGRWAARQAGIAHVINTVHVAERRWRPWQFAWSRLTAGGADRIVCVSQGVRDFHQRRTGIEPGKYRVIYNGVDAAAYARDERLRLERRAQWSLGESDVLCAFVGRLDEQKGVDVLLAAFETALRQAAHLHLVMAGDGPLRAYVEAWQRRSPAGPRVRVLGRTEDVPGVLSAADLFCQPSRWEGFCLAAAEAMAAGLAVAATDVAGLNEVVADNETGLLCPADDPSAFAANIVRLARDAALRSRLGAAGRRRVVERFGIERFVAEHAQLYREIKSEIRNSKSKTNQKH